MVSFVANITFNPTQVYISLLFVFFSDNSIIAICQGVKKLALLPSFIQTKIFFGELTQSLIRLVAISTIIIGGREFILFSLKVLLVLKFFVFYRFIAIRLVRIAFSH